MQVQTNDTANLGFSASAAPRQGGGSVVTVLGELDMHSAPRLGQVLDQAIDEQGDVELDLRACSFVDSMGIATMVAAARQLGEERRTLLIKGARERVRRILELAGLVEQHWVEFED